MKVNWTSTAEDHLDGIYKFISQNSAHYALRMVDRITQRSIQVSEFPFSGRVVPEYFREDIREVFEGPYRIIYAIKDDHVDVLAVLHGARLIDNMPM